MHVTEELLRELAGLAQTERNVMSAYIPTRGDWDAVKDFVEKEKKRIMPLLTTAEVEYFDVSLSLMMDYIHKKSGKGYRGPGLAFFADIGADYTKGIELTIPQRGFIAIDDEAIILPLALELDEYEPVGVIMADAAGARVLIVAGKVIDDADSMRTKIHHLSKVGGWSQMRYQRRREKQVKHFAKDVAQAAAEAFNEAKVKRILLAGRERIILSVEEILPKHLREKIIARVPWDLDAADNQFIRKVAPIFEQAEREQEKRILERFLAELRRHELAVAGIDDTQKALEYGQVDTLLLDKSIDRELAERLASLAEAIDAHVEFIPPGNDLLKSVGGIGAMLRYKIYT